MPELLAEFDWQFIRSDMLLMCGLIIAIGMLFWDTVEVGRNDAANLVNAVLGARILSRRVAVFIAGLSVILGATFSSDVMDTARKGIFNPTYLGKTAEEVETLKAAQEAEQTATANPEDTSTTAVATEDSPQPITSPSGTIQAGSEESRRDPLRRALAIYISVYIVDTVLLFGYSAFGMPVSTTACLVFELLGAAFVLGGSHVVSWSTAGTVVVAIIMSILASGIVAFFVQRIVRGAIRDRTRKLSVLLAHGGWVGGGMMAGLSYFMLVKGMKKIGFVKTFVDQIKEFEHGQLMLFLGMWVLFAATIHLLLVVFRKRFANVLFPWLAILGTIAMAFAFGQNDLANCASPGLSSLTIIEHWQSGVEVATEVSLPRWLLAGCGILMAMGMMTKNAQRVTNAAVHAGSMAHQVRLYAPNWCMALARVVTRFRGKQPALAPAPVDADSDKTMHYDVLRACVILAVSASVIASASSAKMPVSTTYVAFAAVVATGMADRILQRGDAELKMARTIWVVFSWFASAGIAAVATGGVAWVVFHLGWKGMLIGIGANLAIRIVLKRRADRQEQQLRAAADERKHPDRYAEIDENE